MMMLGKKNAATVIVSGHFGKFKDEGESKEEMDEYAKKLLAYELAASMDIRPKSIDQFSHCLSKFIKHCMEEYEEEEMEY